MEEKSSKSSGSRGLESFSSSPDNGRASGTKQPLLRDNIISGYHLMM